VAKAAKALNGTGYKDHDPYVVHRRVLFDIYPGLQELAGVVDAIVSGVSGLSRNSPQCTKSMFSQCSVLATNSSFQDSHHRFLIKSRCEKSKLRKARRLGTRAAAEIRKPAASQLSNRVSGSAQKNLSALLLMTAQF
jgi:hypothetical protein